MIFLLDVTAQAFSNTREKLMLLEFHSFSLLEVMLLWSIHLTMSSVGMIPLKLTSWSVIIINSSSSSSSRENIKIILMIVPKKSQNRLYLLLYKISHCADAFEEAI